MRFRNLVRGPLSLMLMLAPVCVTLSPLSRVEAAPAPAKVQAVAIKGFAFTPQILIVAPGTTVTWTNKDDDPHTVTANDNSFHSGALDTDGKFSFTFIKPGTYAYFCSLHPHMTGKVIVKAG